MKKYGRPSVHNFRPQSVYSALQGYRVVRTIMNYGRENDFRVCVRNLSTLSTPSRPGSPGG